MAVNLWYGTHLRILHILATSSKVNLRMSLIENFGTQNLIEDWLVA